MYRKPKFLQLLHEIRQNLARDCDYDIDRFMQRLQRDQLSVASEMNPKATLTRSSVKLKKTAKSKLGR